MASRGEVEILIIGFCDSCCSLPGKVQDYEDEMWGILVMDSGVELLFLSLIRFLLWALLLHEPLDSALLPLTKCILPKYPYLLHYYNANEKYTWCTGVMLNMDTRVVEIVRLRLC